MADRSITLNLGAKVTGFVNGMRTAQKSAEDFVAKGMDKIANNSQAINTLSNTAAVLGTGMVAAFGAATKAAIDWESAFAGVLKTVEGTPEELAAIEEGLREMARTMPLTHEELAGVAEAAGQLGVQTDGVLEFTETMAQLGVTTNLAAEEAATALARISNIMGTSTDDVGRMGATIVDLGNNAATTESEIVELATRLAAAGRQAGLTEANIFAIASTLTSVGVEAEAGGTAMSKVFTSIGDAVRDGGDNLRIFAEVAGMTAQEFQQAFGQDAAMAIGAFVEGMGRLGAEGEATSTIFKDLGLTDQRLMRAIMSAGTATGLWADQVDLANEAWENNTALIAEAETRFATAESQMTVAWNNIRDAAIEFGAVALPYVAELAGSVADVARAFGELPDGVQTALMALVGGGGLVLLGVAGMGRLLTAVAEVRGAIQTLGLTDAASRMGRLAGSVGRFATKAGIAGVAAAGIATGIKAIVDSAKNVDRTAQSLEEIENALLHADEAGSAYEATLGNLVEQGAAAEWAFGDMKTALDSVVNANPADDFFAWLNIDATGYKETRDAFRDIGEMLGGLATTDLESATDQFRRFWIEAGATDQAAQDLLEVMPAYEQALYGVANEAGMAATETDILRMATGDLSPVAEDAADSQETLADATDGTTDSMEDQAEVLAELIELNASFAGIVLTHRQAQRNLEQSYADLTAAIEDNGTTFDITTEKGRANQSALDDIAKASWDLIEAMAANGASQEELQATMQVSRDRFIEAAVGAGVAEDAARALADELLLVPEAVSTAVEVTGIDTALSRLGVLDRTLNNINGKQVTASVAIRQYGQAALAAGGPVIGPGTGTSDSVPAMLSNGEHVLTAAEVAAAGGHGAIYAMRSAIRSGVAKFAEGGPVQYVPSFARGGAVSPPPALTLEGVRIRGRLDLGDGLVGFVDGRIVERERQMGAYS